RTGRPRQALLHAAAKSRGGAEGMPPRAGGAVARPRERAGVTDRLPRGIERLLRGLLPRDLADPIAGDLLEEYLAARGRLGALLAAAGVGCQGLRVAVVFRWERLAHGRGLPPIGEELRTVTSFRDSLRRDVMFSVRMLRRQPGFSIVVLVTLALGIGANTA